MRIPAGFATHPNWLEIDIRNTIAIGGHKNIALGVGQRPFQARSCLRIRPGIRQNDTPVFLAAVTQRFDVAALKINRKI